MILHIIIKILSLIFIVLGFYECEVKLDFMKGIVQMLMAIWLIVYNLL